MKDGVGTVGEGERNPVMADWMAAMSSRAVGLYHLLPAAARFTSFFK